MTAEEAIKIFKSELDWAKQNTYPYISENKVNAIKLAIQALEVQPNRCDICKHSEERDGSNCYECVKGMADNFEAQPTNAVKCDCTTEEIAKSFTEDVEAVKDRLDGQPSEDCISRKSLRQKLQEEHDFFVNSYGGFSNLRQNDKARVDEIINCIVMVVNEPSVHPQRKRGKWIKTGGSFRCSECLVMPEFKDIRTLKYCPNCGAEMSGGGEECNSTVEKSED